MRIKKMVVKNYRTLRDIEISFRNDYCTISGRNNAGKSCIINLIMSLFGQRNVRPWLRNEYAFDYGSDHTSWDSDQQPIEITWTLCLNRQDEPSLVTFVSKISDLEIVEDIMEVAIKFTINQEEAVTRELWVGGNKTSEDAAKEIIKRLQSSNSVLLHNSTTHEDELWIGRGGLRAVYEVILSAKEQEVLSKAEANTQKQIKKLAKSHRDELNTILGKLNERLDVEFSSLESYATRRMPLGINLRDKKVEVPLNSWGSGTQNRTYVLMSVLQAKRIKARQDSEDGITPIVVVEEPESFLHPSAQAEFGRLLQLLSAELGIQIIVSTHSPYMLNQSEPSANILLERKVRRGSMGESIIVNTTAGSWMEPFADHLGVVPQEFESWKLLFASEKHYVLLVEGELDKNYLDYLRKNYKEKFGIPNSVEIVPYDGVSALNNTVLLKFIMSRQERTFITFDLDSQSHVEQSLNRLGLKEGDNYLAIGLRKPGKDCIEGLLPNRVTSTVHARENDLVMQLASAKPEEKKAAKSQLKQKYFDEFTSTDCSDEELSLFFTLGKRIGRIFS